MDKFISIPKNSSKVSQVSYLEENLIVYVTCYTNNGKLFFVQDVETRNGVTVSEVFVERKVYLEAIDIHIKQMKVMGDFPS